MNKAAVNEHWGVVPAARLEKVTGSAMFPQNDESQDATQALGFVEKAKAKSQVRLEKAFAELEANHRLWDEYIEQKGSFHFTQGRVASHGFGHLQDNTN